MGTRFGNRTKEMPKGFVSVGGIPIIERSIAILKEHGIENIILGCGHQKQFYENLARKYDFTIYVNHDYKSTESLHTLVLADPYIKGDTLLLESDLLYERSAIEKIMSSTDPNVILASGFTNSRDEVYILADSQMNLVALTKDVSARTTATAELVGISKLSYSFFKQLVALHNSENRFLQEKYEDGIVAISKQNPVRIEKYENLIWCEMDDEIHLHRAIHDIFPKIQKVDG